MDKLNKPTKLELHLNEHDIPLIRLYEKLIRGGKQISYQTLWNIYHGRTNPKLTSLQMIADALETEISEVF